MRIRALTHLFTSFFKVGMIAFGGGYAVAPLLQKEAVEHRKWITNEELVDIMAIAQTLPGIIFTNSSTMIGYRVAGFWGSVIATAASVFPTFAITILFTAFFWNFTDNPLVQKTFTGILIGVTALILHAILKMWKSAVKNYFDILLVLLSTACLILFKASAIFIILGVAILGFTRNFIAYRSGGKKA